jgi:hypothetical protein
MTRRKWKKQHGDLTLRSGFEAKTAKYLDGLNAKYGYEVDKLSYVIPESTHKYTPDFKLENGIYVETKGRWTAADRKKMSLVIEQNPELDIRMLFMTDNTLNRSSKTKYSDWCEKRGIKCYVSSKGEVPMEWLKEKQQGETKHVEGKGTKAGKRSRKR